MARDAVQTRIRSSAAADAFDGGESFAQAAQASVAPGILRLEGRRAGADLATVAGLAAAVLLIGAAIVLGGSPTAFLDLPSALIVIGGTVTVTVVSFSLSDVALTSQVLATAFRRQATDRQLLVRHLLKLSEIARSLGPEALRTVLPDLATEVFLQRSIGAVADGLPPDEIERMLVREIEATADRHARGISVLRRGGEVAPAMGLIGTLIGLVQMLGSLNDPSAIGPSMAIALLTTFYGAFLSSVVLLPLAVKLERNSDDERLMRALSVVGAVSMARQESPRRLEMLLNTMLPPAERLGRFDE